jgi:thiosulfate dehydrogenase
MVSRFRVLAAAAVSGVIGACTDAAPPPPIVTHRDSSAVTFREAAWTPKREKDIPNDSMGASIRRGLYLLRFTPESLPDYATSNLRCTSCHQDDGIRPTSGPLTGSHARFPKYMARSGTVIALADRVNYCFTRSLSGNAIPVGSREMIDILAYLAFISADIPVGAKIAGADGLVAMPDTLDGDVLRGQALYASKLCVTCHGPDGGGNGPIPPLWGPKSYSVGASMSRIERAASFIKHNMPQTSPGSLSAQEAFDLSAFINSHPRPDSPGKERDWPMGGAPADVPYDTRGHIAFRPPPILPRATPNRALWPNPATISHAKR